MFESCVYGKTHTVSISSTNWWQVLNTIMADQLIKFKAEVDALIAKNVDKDEAIFQVLRKYIVESKKIRFEGNGYGEEWVKEAAKRGLNNIKTTPPALDAFLSKSSIFQQYEQPSGLEPVSINLRFSKSCGVL